MVTVSVVGAILALGVSGCGAIQSPGPVKTQEREVAGVHAVKLSTSGHLTIEHGDEPSLTITTGERRLEHLTSKVHDGVLVLDADSGMTSWGGSIEYVLVVDELDAVTVDGSGDVSGAGVTGADLSIELSGSGTVDLSGVAADGVEVTVSGSGDVTLAGATTTTDVEITGSGSVEADGLDADEADVVISGSGDVSLAVAKRLGASISGSGTVSYTGTPAVSSSVTGSGDVFQVS